MAATLREYLDKLGVLTLWAQIKDIFATKEEVSAKADTADVLIPNFDGMTPVKVIEFDKSAASWSKLFTRKNTEISTTMSEVQDVVLMRITVTGTNIYSRSDVVIKFQPGLVNPHAYAFHHTYSNAAATTGLQYLRFNYPKALNNDIPWMVDFYQYNATARHYKIEVFATTENITWEESLTATTYNSTNYSTAQMTLYANRGLVWLGRPTVDVNTANSASYLNSYLNKYITGTPIKAGEALVAYNIAFINNGFAYKISNKDIPISPDYGIVSIGTTYAVNEVISYAYLRSMWSFTFTAPSGHGLTYDSFMQGDRAYLRCTMKNGRIYSDAHLAKEMTPGYTWYPLGAMYNAANGLAMNTEGSMFITLDEGGCISHINGKPTQATLMSEGVVQENTFLKRSGTPAGNAEIKEIRGNSIVWNQLLNSTTANDWKTSNATKSFNDGVCTMVATATNGLVYILCSIIQNHTYYAAVSVKTTTQTNKISMSFYGGGPAFTQEITEWQRLKSITKVGSSTSTAYQMQIRDTRSSSWDAVQIKDFILIDLTQMLGPGNEPTSVEEFKRLFPEDYYEYETGTLLNLEMTSIRTEDSNGTEVDSETFNVKTLTGIASGGNTTETIFPYGMCGIGGVQDEIDFEAGKAVKRFGVVDISSLDITRLVSGTRDIYHAPLSDAKLPANSTAKPSVMCAGYLPQDRNGTWTAGQVVLPEVNSTINAGRIGFVTANNIYTDAAAFKSAMSGECLVYELATPIEYSITASAPTYKSAKGGVEKVLPYDDDNVLSAPITAVVHYENKAITLDDDIAYLGEDDGEGHIANGGEVNVIETIKVNGTALVPDSNKAVDLQVKTINNQSIIGTGNISIQGGSGGGGGDENVIEIVKVNGTALTPDANKAVNIDLTDYDKAPLVIEVNDTDTTVPSGTYASITTALAAGRDIVIKENKSEGYQFIYHIVLNGVGDGEYTFKCGGFTFNKVIYIENSDEIYFEENEYNEHSHGNIQRDGDLQTTDISIANGDKLVVTDSSDSNKIARTSLSFDGSTTTKALTPKGTWETFLKTAPVTSVNGQTGTVNLTIPSAPGTLNTTATTAQTTSSSEALSGSITLHKVAKTGTYNDLIGKPTIPAAVTESTVSGWGFTKNTGTVSSLSDLGITATATELNYTDGVTSNIQTQLNAKGTYSMPSGGIPASHLAAGVIPTVPTNVSSFTNDAGYITSANVVTIYSGSTAPSSSLGNNGDIYIQTS